MEEEVLTYICRSSSDDIDQNRHKRMRSCSTKSNRVVLTASASTGALSSEEAAETAVAVVVAIAAEATITPAAAVLVLAVIVSEWQLRTMQPMEKTQSQAWV